MEGKESINFDQIAILVLGFNRPIHLRKLLQSLEKSLLIDQLDIFINIDGPRNQKETKLVENSVKVANNFKDRINTKTYIIENKTNRGLSNSVIRSVSDIFDSYEGIIVLEDDLIISENGIDFFIKGLRNYVDSPLVGSICGYSPPKMTISEDTYFINRADCWGWATWKDRWRKIEWDAGRLIDKIEGNNLKFEFDYFGSFPFFQMLKDNYEKRIDSWAIRWQASMFLDELLTLYPRCSMVVNRGHDNSGSNSPRTNKYRTDLNVDSINKFDSIEIKENIIARNEWIEFYKYILQENTRDRIMILLSNIKRMFLSYKVNND